MRRFPWATITLGVLLAATAWGWTAVLVATSIGFAIVVFLIGVGVGIGHGRHLAELERDAELQALLEPTDEEIEQMEADRGWR